MCNGETKMFSRCHLVTGNDILVALFFSVQAKIRSMKRENIEGSNISREK